MKGGANAVSVVRVANFWVPKQKYAVHYADKFDWMALLQNVSVNILSCVLLQILKWRTLPPLWNLFSALPPSSIYTNVHVLFSDTDNVRYMYEDVFYVYGYNLLLFATFSVDSFFVLR